MSKLPTLLSLGLLALATSATAATQGLPIVNDDWAAARAAAVRRHVPIFVEAWAPW